MLNHFPKDNNAILEIDLKGLTSNYNTLNKKLSDGIINFMEKNKKMIYHIIILNLN